MVFEEDWTTFWIVYVGFLKLIFRKRIIKKYVYK